jgi:preprotein translocase subunit SecF
MSDTDQGRLDWGVFLPILLLAAAMLMQGYYQRTLLLDQTEALAAQWEQQQSAMQEGQKLRKQLESIAGATASLAEQGNANAILIRNQLQSRGITIRPPG